MKIVLINHTFQLPRFYKRWQMLAKEHSELDLTLITPLDYKWNIKESMIFGNDISFRGSEVEDGNFRVIPVHTENHKFLSWTSSEMIAKIKEINPDIIYHIGTHGQDSLMQCLKIKKSLSKNTKTIAFSMRGPRMNIRFPKKKHDESFIYWFGRIGFYLFKKYKISYLNRNCDAILCHYPAAVRAFREEGYKKAIYMSTQVGVDTDIFHPSTTSRLKIRKLLSLGDAFVFGCACRFIPDKGLHEIIEALPQGGNWKCLLMGKGDVEFTKSLKTRIAERGFENKIIFTGFLEWDQIAEYWNAIDCALHVPRTTELWEETFSLAVVQAMATGKPVIGNDSGSVPYQLGPDGIIVPEGDINALQEKIKWVISNPVKAQEIGNCMMNYAYSNFSLPHLNNHFYRIIKDIEKGGYSSSLIDMTQFCES